MTRWYILHWDDKFKTFSVAFVTLQIKNHIHNEVTGNSKTIFYILKLVISPLTSGCKDHITLKGLDLSRPGLQRPSASWHKALMGPLTYLLWKLRSSGIRALAAWAPSRTLQGTVIWTSHASDQLDFGLFPLPTSITLFPQIGVQAGAILRIQLERMSFSSHHHSVVRLQEPMTAEARQLLPVHHHSQFPFNWVFFWDMKLSPFRFLVPAIEYSSHPLTHLGIPE